MRKSALVGKGASLGTAANMAGWLYLAATPTFALMALISAADSPGTICSTALPLAAIDSMALMYLLMALFHLPPWLKLLSSRPASSEQQTEGD